jgi:hypothetical protein
MVSDSDRMVLRARLVSWDPFFTLAELTGRLAIQQH